MPENRIQFQPGAWLPEFFSSDGAGLIGHVVTSVPTP